MKAICFVGSGSLVVTALLTGCLSGCLAEPSTSDTTDELGREPSTLDPPIRRAGAAEPPSLPVVQPLVPGARQVGYYDVATESGEAYEIAPIVAAGGVAIDIDDPKAAVLANLNVLWVTNPLNFTSAGEYLSRVTEIGAAVRNGMVLVVHDRDVALAHTLLPGADAITTVRDTIGESKDINVRDGSTPVTAGLDNSSLDGGNSSNHGYVLDSTLPSGSKLILSSTTPNKIVTLCYPLGSGAVIYSTIPLDFYLQGLGPQPVQYNAASVYAPNVVSYALAGACSQRVGPRPTPNLH